MILCLLLRNDGIFVNSRNFSLQPVGELEWIMRYLNFDAIDELVLLNVDRAPKEVDCFCEHMRNLARYCFVPISAGGGVNTLEDFAALLDSGSDKVVINSAAIERPEFVSEAARRYGSQCVVVSIDYKKTPNGQRTVFSRNGGQNTGIAAEDWAREVESLGAGEIFLTSIDHDGIGKGYDLEFIEIICRQLAIPVIASGGVGEFEHLVEGIQKTGASAVSAANIFHYIGEGLTKAKKHIVGQGLDFPLWNFD